MRYGAHPEYLVQSDQFPFLQRGVPALYFGVEDHADYHQVTDHADKILPKLAARVARLVVLAAVELANENP
ncbi:MAG: M28 family peptidase [Planctomycetota bacterium]